MNQIYGIPNCDTVKRARAWLAEHAIAADFHDFRKQGISAERLGAWIAACGWERVLNRRGTSWRGLTDSERAAVVDADTAIAAMLQQPSLVKRPVVEWENGTVSVGFEPGHAPWVID
jgi:Spx/MgsR family transcriptional regulator